jgi:DNA-binding CsgD family transcriptional regulator
MVDLALETRVSGDQILGHLTRIIEILEAQINTQPLDRRLHHGIPDSNISALSLRERETD